MLTPPPPKKKTNYALFFLQSDLGCFESDNTACLFTPRCIAVLHISLIRRNVLVFRKYALLYFKAQMTINVNARHQVGWMKYLRFIVYYSNAGDP